MIEGVASGGYAVEQALQPVLEDRVEVEVERFPDDMAEPGMTGGACLLAQAAAGASFEAFITFVRGVSPDQTGRVPRWLLRVILRCAIRRAELRQNLALMPQAISEHAEIGRLDERLAAAHRLHRPQSAHRPGSGTC